MKSIAQIEHEKSKEAHRHRLFLEGYGKFLVKLDVDGRDSYTPFRYVSALEISVLNRRRIASLRHFWCNNYINTIGDSNESDIAGIPVYKTNNYNSIESYIYKPGFYRVEKPKEVNVGEKYDIINSFLFTSCDGGIPMHHRTWQMRYYIDDMVHHSERAEKRRASIAKKHISENRRKEITSAKTDYSTEQFFNTLAAAGTISQTYEKLTK